MDFLDTIMETRKARLGQSALCAYMADRRVDPYRRLSFVPAMMFFTMGFKDILAALRDDADGSPLQQCMHRHCDEDAFHWQDGAGHPGYLPSEDERSTAGFLVSQVFDTFRRMFDCWHAARPTGEAFRPAA